MSQLLDQLKVKTAKAKKAVIEKLMVAKKKMIDAGALVMSSIIIMYQNYILECVWEEVRTTDALVEKHEARMRKIHDAVAEMEKKVPKLSKALSMYKIEKDDVKKNKLGEYIRSLSASLRDSYSSISREIDKLKLKIGEKGTIGELRAKRKAAVWDGVANGIQGAIQGCQCYGLAQSGSTPLAIASGLLTALSIAKVIADVIVIAEASKRIKILETFFG